MTTTATKERPILFSGPMVRALLDGRKTQTRRIVKPQPDHFHRDIIGKPQPWNTEDWNRVLPQHGEKEIACPYGCVGDRLWVRETWSSWLGAEEAGSPLCVRYKADGESLPLGQRWKPSIHMLRLLSRLTLEITDVRVERLDSISEAGAIAEGPPEVSCDSYSATKDDPRADFRALWTKINGVGSWVLNPWVWVLTFKVLTPAAKPT